ncbi:hypothetical protein KAS08_00930 [Candidatus Pacearchaeota archaeon]|nr:hypothetical protein [Candidatus Pacearchaeota archaeon]
MGLFNKKESVPEIPTAPSLPELPTMGKASEKKDLPELPSFPSSPKNESFNQAVVKSAVSDSTIPNTEETKESLIPQIPKVNETPEPTPVAKPFEAPAPLTFPTPASSVGQPTPVPSVPAVPTPIERTSEPIFVRIDKFQESQKDFDDIKDRVGEIESVLQKIKEVKIREEEELKGWAEDVEKIKLKLGVIDTDIFSQI